MSMSWVEATGRWEVTRDGIVRFHVGNAWECEFTRIDDNTFESRGTGTASKEKSGTVRLTKESVAK